MCVPGRLVDCQSTVGLPIVYHNAYTDTTKNIKNGLKLWRPRLGSRAPHVTVTDRVRSRPSGSLLNSPLAARPLNLRHQIPVPVTLGVRCLRLAVTKPSYADPGFVAAPMSNRCAYTSCPVALESTIPSMGSLGWLWAGMWPGAQ